MRRSDSNALSKLELLTVVCATLVFLLVLFPRLPQEPFAYFSSDQSELYFPLFVFLGKNLSLGHFPILNRFWLLGALPFAPLEGNSFYPPVLFASWIASFTQDLDRVYAIFLSLVFAHYVLAAVNMFILLRHGLKLRFAAALLGALVYACSGSFVGRFTHCVVLITLAWLPLLLYATVGMIQTRRLSYYTLALLLLWIVGSAGHPQWVYYSFLLYLFVALSLVVLSKKSHRLTCLLLTLSIFVLAGMLNAPRFLLMAELAGMIDRVDSGLTIYNLFDSIHPLYYLTLFNPFLFGKHFQGYWGTDNTSGNWESLLYIGFAPLLLLSFCLFSSRQRLVRALLLCTAITSFLMLGKYSSLSTWVNQVSPFATQFTMLSKYSTFFHLFFSMLAALGIDAWLSPGLRVRKFIFLLFILTAIGVVLFELDRTTLQTLQPAMRPPPDDNALKFAYENLLVARFIFVLAGLSLLVATWLPTTLRTMLILPLFALDLSLTVAKFNPMELSRGPPSVHYGSNEREDLIRQDPSVFRVFHLDPHNGSLVKRFEADYGYHTVRHKRTGLIASSVSFEPPVNRRIFDFLGIKYLFVDNQFSGFDMLSIPGITEIVPNLLKNDFAYPRVFYVPTCDLSRDLETVRSKFQDPKVELRQTVLLLNNDLPDATCGHDSSPSDFSRVVEVKRLGETYIRASVATGKEGFLVFTQPQYPGWFAEINGEPTELLDANVAFYAVKIGPEHAVVDFKFQSRTFRFGLLLAFLSLVGICLSTYFFLRKGILS